MSLRGTKEVAMLGASLVGAFAVARLTSGAYVAAMVTAAIGALVVTVLRRRPVLGVSLGVLAVGASALGWGVRAASGSWVPTPHRLRSLHHSLQAARSLVAGFHLPLPHTPAIVALVALVSGVAAVGGRGLGIRHPGLSLIPAAALVVWSATLVPSTGAAFGGLALGTCGFLALAGDLRTRPGVTAGVAVLSLALAAVALSWTTEAGSTVVAPSGPAASEVAPSALSLATDLTGLETRDAHVVLFRARTPIATYWQVTSLTAFSGGQWTPDPDTSALLHGSAPTQVAAAAPGPSTFAAEVSLSTYSGRLLPAPPATVLASGSPTPVVTPSGVVATTSYASGSSYTARAVTPSPVTDSSAPPAQGGAAPADYTATGPLPAAVSSLSLAITGGQTTTLDKAEALVDFFRSGRFHYRVDATQPAGSNPLVAFLNLTHTGSCQEFAGAFAMLARASGLPTRVAIGFTPGRTSRGTTVVRGSDAHAWPQVLIGGSWVSFEPTPHLPSGELTPPGVLGPAALSRPATTSPITRPQASIPSTTTPKTALRNSPAAGAANHPAGATVVTDVMVVIALVLVIAGAVMALTVRRRRRRPPVDRVVGAWRSVDRALRRRRLGRPPWRTPMGHIGDLAVRSQDEQALATVGDLRRVALVMEHVAFGAAEVAPDEAEAVVQAGRRARRAVRAGTLSEAATASGGRSPASPVTQSRDDVPVRSTPQ